MSEKKYDSLSKALMSLYAPLGDIEAEQDMLNERSRGAERIPEGEDMSQYSNVPVKTPDAVVKMLEIEGGLASLPKAIPKKVDLGTVAVAPTPEQIADANTPRLGDKIDLIKKRESVGDTNYLQKGETKKPKETVGDKQTGLNKIINSPLLTDSYFDTILTTQEFKNIYSGHNPQTEKKRKIKPREEKWDASYESKINDPEINKNVIKNNVVDIIDSVIPAFPELKRHKAFNRNSFINLAKFESMAGGDLVNEKTKDYGMFQLNKTNINNLFSTDAFENSFKKYYGGQAENATGYSADDLKKLYDKNPEKFVTEFLKNNHKVNLAVSIAGSIMPNLDAKMSKKQSGGIVKDPYKRQPRFI